MARYNEILVGRYARGIQKLFGVKGEVPVASLAGEIVVSHVVFNGNENRILEGWTLFGVSMGPTGGVAQSAAVRLRNPASSNVIAVLQGLIISTVAVNAVSVFETQLAADLTTVQSVTTSRLDSRGLPQPTCVPSFTTNYGAIPTVQTFSLNFPANSQPFQLINHEWQELPLLPGNTWDVAQATANQNLIVSFLWRERFLEE